MKMTPSPLFTETQRFTQWWLWLLMAGINSIFLYGIYQQIIGGEPWGDKPMGDTGLLLTAGLVLLLTISLLSMRLETQLKKDGIYVRFFPFHLKFRHYAWDGILKCFVRKYNPIGEYGGWGIRFGGFGRGRALNVSGNMGLQLEFTDHKKLLIGTNEPEELTIALRKLGKLKP